jgi:hypothetical protein
LLVCTLVERESENNNTQNGNNNGFESKQIYLDYGRHSITVVCVCEAHHSNRKTPEFNCHGLGKKPHTHSWGYGAKIGGKIVQFHSF